EPPIPPKSKQLSRVQSHSDNCDGKHIRDAQMANCSSGPLSDASKVMLEVLAPVFPDNPQVLSEILQVNLDQVQTELNEKWKDPDNKRGKKKESGSPSIDQDSDCSEPYGPTST